MTQITRDISTPVAHADDTGSGKMPEPSSPYFDQDLGAWVLTRYVDVYAALHNPALWPDKLKKRSPPKIDRASQRKMREDTMRLLSPEITRSWEARLTEKATAVAGSLPTDIPIDLMQSYATPLCMFLAEMVTAISHEQALLLYNLARIVSAAAADPYDRELSQKAEIADMLLKMQFKDCPEGLGDSTFVALTQTIPCMLGSMWFALAKVPMQWAKLHQHHEFLEQAIEELTRYTGFVRMLVRYASDDTLIGNYVIHKGEKLILQLEAAHRDPQRYADPNLLIINRPMRGSLGFGAGSHSCVGAGLVRMALAALTAPLLEHFPSVELGADVAWRGGSVFRAPESLWVRLSDR